MQKRVPKHENDADALCAVPSIKEYRLTQGDAVSFAYPTECIQTNPD